MVDDSNLAPSNRQWHINYVKAHLAITEILNVLQNDPDFEDGEDLKDWVETVATLISFHPLTRNDIELQAREEWRKEKAHA